MSAVMLEIEVVAKVNRKDIFANRDNGHTSATAYIVLYLRIVVLHTGFSESFPKLKIESYPLPLTQSYEYKAVPATGVSGLLTIGLVIDREAEHLELKAASGEVGRIGED